MYAYQVVERSVAVRIINPVKLRIEYSFENPADYFRSRTRSPDVYDLFKNVLLY